MSKAPRNGHLKHRAVISTKDYRYIDDPAPGSVTDARALSLGLSTWDPNEISAKIWRHSGSQWKRSSEEMPLHRVLDCTIMIIAGILNARDNKLENYFLDLEILDKWEVTLVNDFLIKNKDVLGERLEEISLLLKKYSGG
jgi:hypothetical protein